jgi:hypothetical protein
MKSKITTNRKSRLYVIPAAHGFSCLGFDVAARRAAALASEMGLPAPTGKPGTLKLYRAYQDLIATAHKRNQETGWRSISELTPALIGLEGKRVEVIHQWKGENPETVRFIVGKSTGFIPCHLEIKRRDSTGGGAVCLGKIRSIRVVS